MINFIINPRILDPSLLLYIFEKWWNTNRNENKGMNKMSSNYEL